MPDSAKPSPKRAYDAGSRRERAEQERRDTRAKVLAAAKRRFLADGYTATKMVDIADEAGVALASVYRAGRSKASLIQMLLEEASTADGAVEPPDRPPMMSGTELPTFPLIAAESNPERQVEMIAERIAEVMKSIGPLWSVFRDAAGVDTEAAAAMDAALEHRAAAFEVAIRLLPAKRLRSSRAECADTLWALSSPDTYLMLRSKREWTHRRYADWLGRSLHVLLLNDPADASSSRGRRAD